MNQYIGDILFGILVYSLIQLIPRLSTNVILFISVAIYYKLVILVPKMITLPIASFLASGEMKWIGLLTFSAGCLLMSQVDDLLSQYVFKQTQK